MKTALITGITGQDGSYLAELLLSKGYCVTGIMRRSSSFNTGRINHIFDKLHLHYGDLTDAMSLAMIVQAVKPDEVYNLGAQSHVRVSFDMPAYTFETIANGTLNLLEAVRRLDKPCKFYQASSSEMFGSSPPPQNENTPFKPRSPYAVAKVAAFHQTVNYREAYGMFCCNGILFNHESPRRGETFFPRKVARAVTRIKLGLQEKLYHGNLESFRDIGWAPDYVEAMWLMMQQDKPDDFVIATGESVEMLRLLIDACKIAGVNWKQVTEHDERFNRPSEVNALRGDATKAMRDLEWMPTVKYPEIIELMIAHDFDLARREVLCEA